MNNLLYSDGGEFIIVAIAIIWSALCLILFFKVWDMTNNVKKILDILTIQYGIEEPENKPQLDLNPRNFCQPKKGATKKKVECDDTVMIFFKECTELFRKCNSKEEFENQVDYIIDKYLKKNGNDYSYLKDGLWDQLKQL